MQRLFLAVVAASLALALPSASAQISATYQRPATGAGNWNDSTRWTLWQGQAEEQLFPNGVGQIAYFSIEGDNMNTTVNQNVAAGITLGSIVRNTVGGNFILGGTTAATTYKITLEAPTGEVPTIISGAAMNIKTPLAGTQGVNITITTGTLAMMGDNSQLFGPITISGAGTVRLDTNSALGIEYNTVTLTGGSFNFLTGVTITGKTLLMQSEKSLNSPSPAGVNTKSAWEGDIFLDRLSSTSATPTFGVGSTTANHAVGRLVIGGSITTSAADATKNNLVYFGNTNAYDLCVVELKAENPYTNDTQVVQGGAGVSKYAAGTAIAIGSDQAFGTGALSLNSSAVVTSFFSTTDDARLIRNNFTWNANAPGSGVPSHLRYLAFGAIAPHYDYADPENPVRIAYSTEYGNGDIVFSGNFTINNVAETERLNLLVGASDAHTTTIQGVLSGTTDCPLYKWGAGKLLLDNKNNTFAGHLTVKAGTLDVKGNYAGSIDIDPYAALIVRGNIAGSIYVSNYASLEVGDYYNPEHELGVLAILGSLILDEAWSLMLYPNSRFEVGGEMKLISCSNITGTWDEYTIFDLTGMGEPLTLDFRDGDGLYLIGLSIPEPTTWALLGASLLVVTLFRRRK